MMSFLSPWLFFGLLALGAPLYLHLRRRQEEKVVYFAALRFLADEPIIKRPPRTFQNLFVLLLRLLGVGLLVTAFAQPFFPTPLPTVSSTTIYILDNTLSRQVDHGMERDRDTIMTAISNAGPHSQIAVVVMAYQPTVLVGFGDGPQQALDKLRDLKPTHQRGALIAALREAELLLKQSLGEKKKIIVLSDHQENQWTENANAPPFLPAGIVSLSPYCSVPEKANFYVTDPRLERLFLGDLALIRFSALLGHTGKGDAATVSLTANEREIFHQDVKLDPTADKLTLTTKPWPADPSIWLEGKIAVTASQEEDCLPDDNIAYFALPPVAEGKVALLTKSVFLQTALSPAVVKGRWHVTELQPANLSPVLNAPNDDADVLMIDGSYLQSGDARALASRYLQKGHGVFIMVDELTPLMTTYIQDLGFDTRTRLVGAEDDFEPIRYFSQESPIFQPFQFPDFSNLLEVRVGETVHLSSGAANTLLYGHNGESLLFSGNKERGRFLLSTFTFDRNHTDWVIHPSFVPFLDLALQYLRPTIERTASLEPGESWLIRLPDSRTVKSVVLRDKTHEIVRAVVDSAHHAVVTAPDQPGNYYLTYDESPVVEQMLSVNPSILESDLHYLQHAPDVLAGWTQVAPDKNVEQPPEDHMLPPEIAAANQDYWWVLLMAGAVILLTEMGFLLKPGAS